MGVSMKGDEEEEGDEGNAPPPPSTVSLYSLGVCSFVRSFEHAPGRGEEGVAWVWQKREIVRVSRGRERIGG